MSEMHGCSNNMVVVDSFKEALRQRIGEDMFQAWFMNGLSFKIEEVQADSSGSPDGLARQSMQRIVVAVRSQFGLDRLRRHFIREMRGAAMQVGGASLIVELRLDEAPQQIALPLTTDDAEPVVLDQDDAKIGKTVKVAQTRKRSAQPSRTSSGTRSKPTKNQAAGCPTQPLLPSIPEQPFFDVAAEKATDSATTPSIGERTDLSASTDSKRKKQIPAQTLATFVDGPCNEFAVAAVKMVCENPSEAIPLYLCGPPGVGKTHLLSGLAEHLRRNRRMRRVVHLRAEQFTNDFLQAISTGNLTAFRSRYRDLDALLIDDVHFFSGKKATIREFQYTIDGLMQRGKLIVFSGSQPPGTLDGLSPELIGRLSSGCICPMKSLDSATKSKLLQQLIQQHCQFSWPQAIVDEISSVMAGDGRRLRSIVNLVSLLQRMRQRMPTMNEIREHGGDQLRNGRVIKLSAIERAVASVFELDEEVLQSKSQARTATEPRMLAMFLSRELTPSAYSEIGKHYGGRSHSAAILAVSRVGEWIQTGKPIGRGKTKLSVREAIDRVESLLRTG